MTLLDQRPTAPAESRYSHRAWIAIALMPVTLVVGVVVSFAGEGGGSSVIGGSLVGLACLLAPTLAVCFAGAAVHAGEPDGRRALAAAVAVLVATVVLLPLVAISFAGWAVAIAIDAVAVGAYFAWRYCR